MHSQPPSLVELVRSHDRTNGTRSPARTSQNRGEGFRTESYENVRVRTSGPSTLLPTLSAVGAGFGFSRLTNASMSRTSMRLIFWMAATLLVQAVSGASRDAQWKKVDEAIQNGLPKTAITELD